MSHASSAALMLMATFLMIAAPIALPLAAYRNCRRLNISATDDIAGALVAGIAIAAVCYMFAKRLAVELV